jgi:hypothetical protein
MKEAIIVGSLKYLCSSHFGRSLYDIFKLILTLISFTFEFVDFNYVILHKIFDEFALLPEEVKSNYRQNALASPASPICQQEKVSCIHQVTKNIPQNSKFLENVMFMFNF